MDGRILTDITMADTGRCWDDVLSLPLKRYMINSNVCPWYANTYDRHVLGFISMDVETVCPKAVFIDSGIHTSNVTQPLLMADKDKILMTLYGAVQECQKKILALSSNLPPA